MLSVHDLITDIDCELNTSGTDRKYLLRRLDRALLAIAGTADLYLPELLEHSITILSVAGKHSCSLPSNFHKKITSVLVEGSAVRVYSSVSELEQVFGGLRPDRTGAIRGVAAQGGKLYYQSVPVERAELSIGYYRKPSALTDSSSCFPEGVSGCNELDECLISHVLWKEYRRIEDGMEGQKVNTGYHKMEFYENLDMLRDCCTRDTGPDTTEPGSEPYSLF